jgi:hypothetical protein
MTKSITQTIDDLRGKLGAAQQRQVELDGEIQKISWAATTGDVKAKKRLDEISNEQAHLATEIKSTTAALAAGARLEMQEREEAIAAKRRDDAKAAELLCAGVEMIAEKFDATLAALAQHAQDYENEMAKIRRLIGAGPTFDLVRFFLGRALRTSIMRTPLHQETIAPGDRVTVSAATATWMQNFRVHIGRTLNVKPAAQKAA